MLCCRNFDQAVPDQESQIEMDFSVSINVYAMSLSDSFPPSSFLHWLRADDGIIVPPTHVTGLRTDFSDMRSAFSAWVTAQGAVREQLLAEYDSMLDFLAGAGSRKDYVYILPGDTP